MFIPNYKELNNQKVDDVFLEMILHILEDDNYTAE